MSKSAIILLIIISIFIFFTSSVVGLGVSPAEIRAQNIIDSGVLGTITIINTINESRYIMISIQSPSELVSEQQHLRVICENCHDTHQRYEIINGKCPKCNSSDLTTYERIPDDVLKYLSLEGTDCTLIKNGTIYVTKEQYSIGEKCNIKINIDLPSEPKYSDKNWEAHISVTTIKNLSSENMGMVAGVQIRLLIDTSNINPKLLSLPADILILFFIALIMIIIFIFLIYIRRNASKILFNNFLSRNILKHKKLKTNNKNNLNYYLNKDKNFSSINNKPIENLKPLSESTNKIKKDNKLFKKIEEEIDSYLSNLKK